MARTKTTMRKTSGNKPKKGAAKKTVKKLPKTGDQTLASTSQSSEPLGETRAAKATVTAGEIPSSSCTPDDLGSEGEDPEPDQLNDPDKAFDDEDEDDEGDHTIWADEMIRRSVHGLLKDNPAATSLELIKTFCGWVDDAIALPSRPSRYKHWAIQIRRAFNDCDERRLGDSAKAHLMLWRNRKAKAMAALKLYEPHPAERFRLVDMIELWLHWLRSSKLVRVEAALYSAMTFFTGARAIEIGKLFIEDLELREDGTALVMPIRESKTNVFKETPCRLTLVFRPDNPIDLKSLYLRVKGDRVEGRLFQACKNRRTLCYHYARGALELEWSRAPTGHSGRTTAITLGIAAGIPDMDLEIMFRWAPNSNMIRRYRSVHMEESPIGAPSMIAQAMVHSLGQGPTGTATRICKTALRSAEVDGGWYERAISDIYNHTADVSGICGARAPRTLALPALEKSEPENKAQVKLEPKEEEVQIPPRAPTDRQIGPELDYFMGRDLGL